MRKKQNSGFVLLIVLVVMVLLFSLVFGALQSLWLSEKEVGVFDRQSAYHVSHISQNPPPFTDSI